MGTAEAGVVLVVAADRRELAGIMPRSDRLERLPGAFRFAALAECKGERLLLVAGGVGAAAAAQAVRRAARMMPLRAVVSAGVCGALAAELRCGDIFVATEVRCLATGDSYAARVPASALGCHRGRLLTADRVIATAGEKRALCREAEAVDMEAAAVAAWAQQAGVSFYAIRVVLDAAEESFRLDYNRLWRGDGTFALAGLARALLAQPHQGTVELLRLSRRLRQAAEKLGEFIVGCRF